MRLVIIGGGGVTTPLVVMTIAKRASILDLEEIVLFDINYDRLALILPVIRSLIDAAPRRVQITPTDDIGSYLSDLDAAIISIRPGLEQGRATDERICKDLGLLSNETTGAAGFVFACRVIPVVLSYAEMLSQANPDIWFVNFTNPAGIVTQALRDSGYQCAVGVCSSADRVRRCTAEFLRVSPNDLTSMVFGLNHLSWTGEICLRGEDITENLLANPLFLRACQPWFPAEFLRKKGFALNEYLYFYYFYDSAMSKQREKPLTRGEEILRMNSALRQDLSRALAHNDVKTAVSRYFNYVRERKGTYMANLAKRKLSQPDVLDEGYSGVALGVLEGLFMESPRRLALCVPLGTECHGLQPTDIVEITCTINEGFITPMHPLTLSADDMGLISSVKAFERETAAAILDRSLERALFALNLHPLLTDCLTNQTFLSHIVCAYPTVFQNWR